METVKAVRIGQALAEADLIIIGASNGLDMAEGLNLFYADAHFQEAYGDLAQADGIGCILQGLTSPDANVRRRWADRFHQKEYVEYEPGPIMNGLRHLTEHADTFVITCNIDGHFARAGFNENHVLETEGSTCTSIDEQRLAHPDALAMAQLEDLAHLVQAHRNHKVVHSARPGFELREAHFHLKLTQYFHCHQRSVCLHSSNQMYPY